MVTVMDMVTDMGMDTAMIDMAIKTLTVEAETKAKPQHRKEIRPCNKIQIVIKPTMPVLHSNIFSRCKVEDRDMKTLERKLTTMLLTMKTTTSSKPMEPAWSSTTLSILTTPKVVLNSMQMEKEPKRVAILSSSMLTFTDNNTTQGTTMDSNSQVSSSMELSK